MNDSVVGDCPSLLFKDEDGIANGVIAVPNDAQSYHYDEKKGTVYFKFWYDLDFIHCFYKYTDFGVIEYEHTGYDSIDGTLEFDDCKYHSMSWGGLSNEEDEKLEQDFVEWGESEENPNPEFFKSLITKEKEIA